MRTLSTLLLCLTVLSHAFAQDKLAQAKPQGSDDWGYIDVSGKFVIDAQYRNCHAFSEGYAPIYDKKAKTFYFIKPDGSKLDTDVEKFKLKNIFGFGTKGFSSGLAAIQVGKKWGYLNTEGKLVIEAKYDKAHPFDQKSASVKSADSFLIINRSGTETSIDASGVEDLKAFSENMAPVKINGLWGFVDATGKVVVEATYKGVGQMSQGLAWVKNEAGKVGFIDATGKLAIDDQFDAAKDFTDGLARVKKNDTWMYVDLKGNTISPASADSYGKFSDGLAYAKKDGKVGFIGKDGKWVIEPKFDKVRDFSNGLAAVRIGEKWGFIAANGKYAIEPQFEAVKDFENLGK